MPNDVLLGNDHLVIAEIAQAHDGSVDAAHRLIDIAARAGATAVKFQTHLAAEESTLREPWRVKFSARDATRFDYWRRMEFTSGQWSELRSHCIESGVEFMSSPFSPAAVELLMEVGVRVWKIASGEVANHQLLAMIAQTPLPVILSSGLSHFDELAVAVSILNRRGDQLAILQCATEYPTNSSQVGLNVLDELRQRFNCVVGVSDHSATIYTAIAAAALGSRVFEVHIREDHDDYGPDSSSSLSGSQLSDLVAGVQFVREALTHPVDKSRLSDRQLQLRTVFGRSLVAARDLPSGSVLTIGDLAFKKPGGGIPYEQAYLVVGKRLSRDLERDEQVTLHDLEAS